MAIHARGVEDKAFTITERLVLIWPVIVIGVFAFLGGAIVEQRQTKRLVNELQHKLVETKAKLDTVQTELDVFLKYIKPEIDSVYQMSQSRSLTYHFFHYGIRYGVPPRLLASIARVESNYTLGVVSHKGASGVLQVIPWLWWRQVTKACGPWQRGDARVEVCAGATVFRIALDKFDGNVYNALSWYNSGYPAHRSTQGRHYAKEVLDEL